jgi:hypothetical protein
MNQGHAHALLRFPHEEAFSFVSVTNGMLQV